MTEPLSGRLLFPFTERSFTFDRYRAFAERLAERSDVNVVPLRDLLQPGIATSARLGLRHDVDVSLSRALALARIEHALGLRATYFVLHTAPYWRSRGFLDGLLELQDGLGHEIGWHNDLVTLQVVHDVDARSYLEEELAQLRDAGLAIEGTASHGSPWCHALGYLNQYFFEELPQVSAFPNFESVPTPWGLRQIPKAQLGTFGFTYEAYFLGEQARVSDSGFDGGRRWHPDMLDLSALQPGETTIVLIHPCHWDSSLSVKIARAVRRIASRLTRELLRVPRPGRYSGDSPPPLH